MKVKHKITLSFLFIIALLGAAYYYTTLTVLRTLQEERISTSEVILAKSLAKRIYRNVIEEKVHRITDVLFDEKVLREDKIEYILVFDKKGYLLAHTYILDIPKQLLKLDHSFPEQQDYTLSLVEKNGLSAYDIAVPVTEGVVQVGSLHIGIKADYVRKLINPTKEILWISVGVSLLAFLIACFISRVITKPLQQLQDHAEQVSRGRFESHIDIQSQDEIGALAQSINTMAEKLDQTPSSKK